jgi:hypothetical protein
MDNESMIEDIVHFLDRDFSKGVGHVNIIMDESNAKSKTVQTFGCTDCSHIPLACSVPTLHQGLDRTQESFLIP